MRARECLSDILLGHWSLSSHGCCGSLLYLLLALNWKHFLLWTMMLTVSQGILNRFCGVQSLSGFFSGNQNNAFPVSISFLEQECECE